MSYRRERDEFFMVCGHEGIPRYDAEKLLRYATTLQRLAEAQCNGDYPADNGERKVVPCPLCESNWVPSYIQGGRGAKLALAHIESSQGMIASANKPEAKACPDCRTTALAADCIKDTTWKIVTNGDPRGAVLSLYPKDAPEADIQSGRVRGLYVPPSTR